MNTRTLSIGLVLLLAAAVSLVVVVSVELSITSAQLGRVRTALVAKHFAPDAEWCKKYGHGGTRLGEQLCLEKMFSIAEKEVAVIAKGGEI